MMAAAAPAAAAASVAAAEVAAGAAMATLGESCGASLQPAAPEQHWHHQAGSAGVSGEGMFAATASLCVARSRDWGKDLKNK